MVKFLRLFSCLFLFISAVPAFACDPGGQADPWFLYEIRIDPSALPEGVRLISEGGNPKANNWKEQQASYYLTNESKTPLYFFRPGADGKPVPLFLLLNNTAYFYMEYGPEENRGWLPNCDKDQDCHSRLAITNVSPKIQKMIPFDDNRPEDVTVPESEPLEIKAYYDKTPHPLKGEIHFRLNEHYDPKAFAKSWAKGVDACNKWHRSFFDIFKKDE